MKFRDPETGEFKELYTKAADTLPVDAVVDFDGDEVPAGWEEFSGTTFKMVDLLENKIEGLPSEVKQKYHTFKEPITNYDFLLFELTGENYGHEWSFIPVTEVRYKAPNSGSNIYYTMGVKQKAEVFAIFQFNIVDANTLYIRNLETAGWTVGGILRIIGIKL